MHNAMKSGELYTKALAVTNLHRQTSAPACQPVSEPASKILPQLLRGQGIDTVPSLFELQPQQRHSVQTGCQSLAGITNLQHQQAIFSQVLSRLAQDAQRNIQPVIQRQQSQLGLVMIFRREFIDLLTADVGWIGDDE